MTAVQPSLLGDTPEPTSVPQRGGVIEGAREEPGDQVFTSVTTVIGVLDKPALIPWAVNETAARVVQRIDILRSRLEQEGEDEAKRWIAGLRFDTGGKISAAELGTLFHGFADDYMLTGMRPVVVPEMHPEHVTKGKLLHEDDVRDLNKMLLQFDQFLAHFQPTATATELVCYHPEYGYAGQVDAFLTIEGIRFIVDYKTSRDTYTGGARPKLKAPYGEVSLQLSGYRYSKRCALWRARRTEKFRRRYYLLSESEKAATVPTPEVDGGAALIITPDHHGFHPVRCDEEIFTFFLNCLEVARFVHDYSGEVVGNAMIPPYPDAELGDPFEGLPRD